MAFGRRKDPPEESAASGYEQSPALAPEEGAPESQLETRAEPHGEDAAAEAPGKRGRPGTMLPNRRRPRFGVETLLMRLVATAGVVGIGVLLGAILISQNVAGWITGLVIALVSVVLSGVLWSSRQL